jgi:hypothetical protein
MGGGGVRGRFGNKQKEKGYAGDRKKEDRPEQNFLRRSGQRVDLSEKRV